MTALASFIDSLPPEQLVGLALLMVAAAMLGCKVIDWMLAGPSLDSCDYVPVVPRPRVQSRMSDADWQRLLDLQAQARADIAAEADSFDRWEEEMAS